MQINVAGSVVPVYPSGAGAALTLFNNGPGLLYLGSDTSLAVNNGFPITAGSAIVWDKGQPLYVISSTVATLFLIENSGPSALGQLSLAPGASIGLAPGSQVALADGTSVAVSSLPPDTSTFWPCVKNENYAPTLSSTSIAYTTIAGNPCITRVSTTSSTAVASWSTLSRYGPSGVNTPTVITALVYANGNSDAYLGWQSSPQNTSVASVYMLYSQGLSQLQITNQYLDISDTVNGWAYIELVYTKTMTRLTVNRDPSRRITVGPMNDSIISAAFNLNVGYTSGCNAISNLFVSYPSTVPA